jgi:hypothetical protein
MKHNPFSSIVKDTEKFDFTENIDYKTIVKNLIKNNNPIMNKNMYNDCKNKKSFPLYRWNWRW